jgi:hypothetical protein
MILMMRDQAAQVIAVVTSVVMDACLDVGDLLMIPVQVGEVIVIGIWVRFVLAIESEIENAATAFGFGSPNVAAALIHDRTATAPHVRTNVPPRIRMRIRTKVQGEKQKCQKQARRMDA